MYPKLNLPSFEPKIISKGGDQRKQIFDRIRKKYVSLTPEEWVRQHVIYYLSEDLGYPIARIGVEMSLKVYGLSKRADILVYDINGKVAMIVECKSFEIKITEDTFDQVARYNLPTRSRFLVVSNGIQHFCCQMDYEQNSYKFLASIPNYKD